MFKSDPFSVRIDLIRTPKIPKKVEIPFFTYSQHTRVELMRKNRKSHKKKFDARRTAVESRLL